MRKLRVFIRTYGCTLNQSDSEAMAGVLLADGMAVVDEERDADVVVLNTCTVKGATEQKTMHEIGRLRKLGKRIVVAGCIPSADLALVRRHAPDAPAVGTRALARIADAVRAADAGKKSEYFSDEERKLELPRARGRVIARVPVAEGCVGACAFCATRIARGKLHSYSEEEIVAEVKKCVKRGCVEIQLTAQDMGAYGLDIGTDLASLLEKVAKIPGEFRVRVGMMNPGLVKRILPSLLKAFRPRKIYKFAHLPVQSGNDAVLKSMKRGYSVREFKSIAKAFRKEFPGITIATDIIVGYPTETRKAFLDTMRLAREMKFEVANISKFTPRPGTEGAKLKPLPNLEVKRRSEEISALCRKISLARNRKLVGKELALLASGQGKARTDEYKLVHIEGKEGRFVRARITRAFPRCLAGERV